MKSAPAAIASTDAWRIRPHEPSSPVSRITLRCAFRCVPSGRDLLEARGVPPTQEVRAVEDDVDLVRAEVDDLVDLGQPV